MSIDQQSSAAAAADGSPELLSTRPAPVAPAPVRGSSGPRAGARRAWRQLTSMRTALLLLGLLALAAIPGSLLPQNGTEPARVTQYKAAHRTLGPLFQRFSLFDVFHAPWFAAVYALLFISLVGCVIPRLRIHARALVRRPPAAPARLGRLPQSGTWETGLSAEEAVAAAAKSLRRKRFRVATDGTTLAAEKGYLRESGNLLFHVALLMLLVGIGLGSMFGYQGNVLLLEGRSFTNVQGLYASYKAGAFTQPSDLEPFQLNLKKFIAVYQADEEPKTYDAQITSNAPGRPPTPHQLEVNHPVTFGNTKVYLIGHGFALHFIVRDAAGKAWFDDSIPCIPQDLTDYLSECIVKVADTGGMTTRTVTDPSTGQTAKVPAALQYGLVVDFAPTAAASPTLGVVSTFPAADRPRAVITAYVGDLDGQPASVYALDPSKLKQISLPPQDVVVAPGSSTLIPLTQGYTLQVAGMSQWASLQIKDDPAKRLTLVAAVLIVLGLIGSLRVRRRRVWLRATPGGPGRTLIEVGGLARTDADDFAREFPGLVARLAGEIPMRRPSAAPGRPPGPDDTQETPGAP